MRILAAHVSQFRNITEARFPLSPRVTAFIGANGQGKTNLLEALYSIAALRPLRSVPRAELIQAGQDLARVDVSVLSQRTGLTHELSVELRRGSRTLIRDGKACDAAAFLGHLVTVAFTPDDLEITKGGPDLRRRLLDRALLNARPAYLSTALRYSRALKARNRVLTEAQSDDVLEAFDETLALAGAAVLSARLEYVSRLAPGIAACFAAIASPAPELNVRYRSTLDKTRDRSDAADPVAALRHALLERRVHDRRRGLTSVGPHLDDLELRMDGAPARMRASQGQHRALVLAIKLAEIALLTDQLGEPPVLLLDDISSELDAERSQQLFASIIALDGQVILSTTDRAQVPVGPAGGEPALRYAVHAGTVRPFDTRA